MSKQLLFDGTGIEVAKLYVVDKGGAGEQVVLQLQVTDEAPAIDGLDPIYNEDKGKTLAKLDRKYKNKAGDDLRLKFGEGTVKKPHPI